MALGLVLAACGGDDPPTCEDVGNRLCADACACTEGAECQLVIGGTTLGFNNEADCVALFVNAGCAQVSGDIDFAACDSDLDSAECVDTGDGTLGLTVPASCNDDGMTQ